MSDSVEPRLNREDTPISSLDDDRLDRKTFAIDLANSIRNLPGTDGMVIGIDGGWGEGKTSVLNMIREALEEDIESVDELPVGWPDRGGEKNATADKQDEESSRTRRVLAWLRRKLTSLRASTSQYFPWDSGAQERLQVVAFEPWQLTGVETITRSLFQDMGRAIGESDVSPQTKELARRMEQLKIAFGAAGDATSSSIRSGWIRTVVGFVSAGGLGYSFGWLDVEALFGTEIFTAKMLVGVASAFGLLASILGKLSGILFAESEIQSKTTEDLREDVRAGLESREHPLVVIIDDVDRLAVDEVLLLFKLIRASGRFPNVIYLLGIDETRVLEMFNKEKIDIDKEYIGKIVQEMYSLPEVPEGKIRSYAESKIWGDDLLGSRAIKQFSKTDDRWKAAFSITADAYFDTRRDVNRFLGYFRLQIGRFIREHKFEANAVDLFALHILRYFEKPVFENLLENEKVLCEVPDDQLIGIDRMLDQVEESDLQSRKSAREEELDKIADDAQLKEAVKRILAVLFPHAAEYLMPESANMNFTQSAWVRERRIAHPFFFRSYFEQRPPKHPLKQPEVKQLQDAISDVDDLFETLKQHREEKRLVEALHVIRERVNGGALKDFKSENILETLAKLESSLTSYTDDRENGLSLIGEPATAIETAKDIVQTIVSESPSDQRREERIETLLMSRAFQFAGQEIEQAENDNAFDEKRLRSLRRKYADQVESELLSMTPLGRRKIDNRNDFDDLLHRFFEWGDAEKATEWLDEAIDNDNLYLAAKDFCERRESDGELVCDSEFLELLDGTLSTRDLREKALEATEQILSSEPSAWGHKHRTMEAVKRLIVRSRR